MKKAEARRASAFFMKRSLILVAHRRENVDCEALFEGAAAVWHVAGNNVAIAGAEYDDLITDGELNRPLGNVAGLFVRVGMERDDPLGLEANFGDQGAFSPTERLARRAGGYRDRGDVSAPRDPWLHQADRP